MTSSINIREPGDTRVPPQLAVSARKVSWWFKLGALVVGGAGAVVFWFDPARHGFYPFCFFHRLTGWQCPGCGGLRAVHQLLHGHVLDALHLNALFVVSLPVLAWFGIRIAWRRIKRLPARGTIAPAWIWVFLAVAVVFSVLRNLPAFAWLAP